MHQELLECITIQKIGISQKQDKFFSVEEAIKTMRSVAMSLLRLASNLDFFLFVAVKICYHP